MRSRIVLGGVLLLGLAVAGCRLTAVPPQESERTALAVDPAAVLPNGLQPVPGVLTGGQPTPEQLVAARDLGVRTVINLRPVEEQGSEEEAEQVAGLGMRYVSIPVSGAAGMTEANARALAAELERGDEPVMVHCRSGNRVGGLFALKALFVDGASADEALKIGLDSGLTGLEPAVRAVLREAEQSGRP